MADVSSIQLEKIGRVFSATQAGLNWLIAPGETAIDIAFQGRTTNQLIQFQSSAYVQSAGATLIFPARIVSIQLQPLTGNAPVSGLQSVGNSADFTSNPLLTLNFQGGADGLLNEPVNLDNGVRVVTLGVLTTNKLNGPFDVYADLSFIFN